MIDDLQASWTDFDPMTIFSSSDADTDTEFPTHYDLIERARRRRYWRLQKLRKSAARKLAADTGLPPRLAAVLFLFKRAERKHLLTHATDKEILCAPNLGKRSLLEIKKWREVSRRQRI